MTRLLEEANCRDAQATATGLVALFRHELQIERAAVREAMLIRDDSAVNMHRRGRLFRRQVIKLMCIATGAALALLALAIAQPVNSGDAGLSDSLLWGYVFLFGTIGGGLSALQRTTARATRGRVPELREHGVVITSLPFAGGAAGLVSLPLVLAGVIPVDHDVATVLSVAFVAGFSERLVVRAAGTLVGGAERPPS